MAPSGFTTRPELTGRFGMVASTHWLASQSGMAVLEAGGNAFDAAVAAGFVLQVVEPHMNGPAGEVPVLGWDAAADAPFLLCGQGVAPASATIEAMEAHGLSLIPGTGLLPAVVPGAFGAWLLLLRDRGTMRLRDVLSYAIGYATDGFPCLPSITSAVEDVAGLFTDHWTSSAQVWMPGGRVPSPGQQLTNPDLAAAYGRVLAEAEAASTDRCEQIEAARRVFYEGFVAEALADAASREVMDGTGRPHSGFLTYEDIRDWRAGFEEPVSFDYAGHTVLKAGPWSQGPVFLQQLALLSGFDLAAMPSTSVELIHTVTECAKLAFADREGWYGDPLHVDVPLDELLSPAYNAARRGLVSQAAMVDGPLPGSVAGREARLPAASVADDVRGSHAGPQGEPMARARGLGHHGDTCHLDVADRFGNLVSATPSGGWLQDSPVVPGLGFPLATRGQMFWLDRDLPNSLAPGKRPRTTLTPTLVLREGIPYLAFGTPGGDMQDQWSLLFFLRHLHHGMNLQESVDAPAWHTTHFRSSFDPRRDEPGRISVESRVGSDVVAGLRARGHDVQVEGPWSLGLTSAVSRTPDGVLRAAANPRGMQGYAVGR
ncbi:MAG: gamma-glutamyltranspeptidase / glutathione hydrolase [Nocardioidaceae bacterium]|nr:gamma-glutamyltranspeptidase / glutathione hydrolase [Nocardioidaceae bacterium]